MLLKQRHRAGRSKVNQTESDMFLLEYPLGNDEVIRRSLSNQNKCVPESQRLYEEKGFLKKRKNKSQTTQEPNSQKKAMQHGPWSKLVEAHRLDDLKGKIGKMPQNKEIDHLQKKPLSNLYFQILLLSFFFSSFLSFFLFSFLPPDPPFFSSSFSHPPIIHSPSSPLYFLVIKYSRSVFCSQTA